MSLSNEMYRGQVRPIVSQSHTLRVHCLFPLIQGDNLGILTPRSPRQHVQETLLEDLLVSQHPVPLYELNVLFIA